MLEPFHLLPSVRRYTDTLVQAAEVRSPDNEDSLLYTRPVNGYSQEDWSVGLPANGRMTVNGPPIPDWRPVPIEPPAQPQVAVA